MSNSFLYHYQFCALFLGHYYDGIIDVPFKVISLDDYALVKQSFLDNLGRGGCVENVCFYSFSFLGRSRGV